MDKVARHLSIRGRVQGVGYRWRLTQMCSKVKIRVTDLWWLMSLGRMAP